jgi:hypothetical protein
MNLKTNVNKIHIDLSNTYQNVEILEKSNLRLGNFIELSVVESNKNLKIQVSKYELEKDVFNWLYFANPQDENSIVERTSTINSFLFDVSDIFEKNRFDSDYLKKLN